MELNVFFLGLSTPTVLPPPPPVPAKISQDLSFFSLQICVCKLCPLEEGVVLLFIILQNVRRNVCQAGSCAKRFRKRLGGGGRGKEEICMTYRTYLAPTLYAFDNVPCTVTTVLKKVDSIRVRNRHRTY
jgi:hypothetical protein